MSDQPDTFMATFKSITAMLGIDVQYQTDAFGRTTPALDRDGMERLRAAAIEHGYPELADGIDHMLNESRS
ncbi:hypothetical protein [Streptomyces sp. SM13]|uniref:hypothetical protein n=1 Tax=Streptomyces sp. SM13 TaxID=1983803 RepID=UPI000CD4C933|nr:hypothetical protein [Streptomyces sp. SM13]